MPAPGRRLSTARKLLFGLLTAGALVLVPLAALELGGRLWLRVRHGVPGHSYGMYVPDPELGAVLGAHRYNHAYVTNDVAMRGRSDLVEPKPPGSLRILCLGGSTTFGYNLREGETWPERLEELLRAIPGHEADQVLNGGKVAWSLGHLVTLSRRDLGGLRPDIVVLYSGANEELNAGYLARDGVDLDDLRARGEWGVVTTSFPFCAWHHRNLVVGRAIDGVIRRRSRALQPERAIGTDDDATWRDSWTFRNYVVMIRSMTDLVRANGGRLLFVVEAGTPDARRLLRYSDAGLEEAARLGVPSCDPRPAFAAEGARAHDLFTETGIHPTADGARILARALLPCVLELARTDAAQGNGPR